MSMYNRIAAGIVSAVVLLAGVVMAESPNLGRALTAADVTALDFTVLPNGQGLPDGSASAVQGEVVYKAHCQSCHGEQGTNGTNDRLAGGRGSINSVSPMKTVGSYWPYATTVFDYVRRAMPLQAPGQLNDAELYAVTAYLLFINDIVERDTVMNARTLQEVEMPNRDNFVWATSP
jgi:mono/diheme cytochrome c family protein